MLKDAGNVNAYSGVVWLFNPGLNNIYNWDVADQECLLHSSTNGGKDGLYATTAGLNHKLKLKVPIAKMEYAGNYRFILHFEDNHAIDYRNHNIEPIENANRPALENNQKGKPLTLETDWMDGVQPCTTAQHKINITSAFNIAFAKANKIIKMNPNHDTNVDHWQYLGDQFETDAHLASWIETNWENQKCDAYLLGAHLYKTSHNPGGYTLTYTEDGVTKSLGMIFNFSQIVNGQPGYELTLNQKLFCYLHELACHNYKLNIGHHLGVNSTQCPCASEILVDLTVATEFCNTCLAKLKKIIIN